MSSSNKQLSALASEVPGLVGEVVDGAHILAREDARAFVHDAVLSAGTLYDYAAALPEAERLQGRDILYSIPVAGSARWIVRRLSHGGLLAPLTGDRFLRFGLPRPFNELIISERLGELGIPSPRVTAAIVYPAGIVYRGEVAREEISDALDLAASLFGPGRLSGPRRLAAMESAGRLLGALHRAHLIHPDLNLRNVLIEWRGEVPRSYVLDVEKCRIASRDSRRRRGRMLARFRRSARKFEALSGDRLSDEEWRAFESSYGSGV